MLDKTDSFRTTREKMAWVGGLSILAVTIGLGAVLVAINAGRQPSLSLGVLGLVPVFLSIRLLPPSLAAALAGFWGLCLVSYPSELARSGAFDFSAKIFAIGIPALHAGVCAVVSQRLRFSPVFITFAWVGVELSFVALGFPRGLLGSFLPEGPVVGWLTSTLGAVFVGLLAAYLATWIALGISETHRLGQQPDRSLHVCVELIQQSLRAMEVVPRSISRSRPYIPRGPPAAFA